MITRCLSCTTMVQWRSQALKSGWAQRVLGTEVPQWGPGAQPRWGLGVKPQEAIYIQTVCSCQMLFYAGLLLSPSSIYPYPPQKLRKCTNPTTQHCRSRVGTCPPCAHPWLRNCYGSNTSDFYSVAMPIRSRRLSSGLYARYNNYEQNSATILKT